MTVINQKKTTPPQASPTEAQRPDPEAHLNFMGGTSYDLTNPLLRLYIVAASSFFGEPSYYQKDASDKRPTRNVITLSPADIKHLTETLNDVNPQEWREMTPAQMMEAAIDAALDSDYIGTLKLAVFLRTEEHIRTTPQVILVRAANHKSVKGTGWVRQLAPKIIGRPDDVTTGMAYQIERYGKPIPNSLKKSWADALQTFSAYQMAKYRMDSRKVSLINVVGLTHPKGEVVDALMKHTLTTADSTWESIISVGGSTRENWEKAFEVMGHMALLRNLRNMTEKGVDVSQLAAKLREGAVKGQQLPFRYLSASKALAAAPNTVSPVIMDVLEDCLELSIGNLPTFSGRVMSLCDNSGSAWGSMTSAMGTMAVAEIANLTGVLTGKRADEGYVGIFGDRLEVVPVQKRNSVLSQTAALKGIGEKIGQGTENGIWLFWDNAIQKKEHWDHVFVYSDMQAGHGGLFGPDPSVYRQYQWTGRGSYIDVPKLIKAYREQVNPNVLVYLVQVAGYKDVLVPEFYERTFILGGWGEGLLRFAASMSEVYTAQNNSKQNNAATKAEGPSSAPAKNKSRPLPSDSLRISVNEETAVQ